MEHRGDTAEPDVTDPGAAGEATGPAAEGADGDGTRPPSRRRRRVVTPEPETPTGRTIAGDPVRRFLLVALGLAVVAVSLGGLHLSRATQWSPFDEHTHIDYAWQISRGSLPRAGSVIAPELLAEWSCARQTNVDFYLPECGADAAPEEYPGYGYNYNSGHPPLYYAVTGVIARAVDAVVPGFAFVTAGRVVSLGWLVAGMVVLYAALRRWRVPWQYAAPAVALLPAFPSLLSAATTINPDAAAVLGGALALWVLARVVVDGKTGWVVPVALTVLVTGTKVMNALALLAVAAVLLGVALWARPPGALRRRTAALALSIPAAVGAVFVAWGAFQDSRAVAGWVSPIDGVSNRPIEGLPFDEWAATFFVGFNLTEGYYLHPSVNLAVAVVWLSALTPLAVSAPFLGVAGLDRTDPWWLIGAATMTGVLVYPTVVQLQVFANSGGTDFFPVVIARYGISLLPLVVACLAAVAARRRLAVPLWAIAGVGWAVMMLAVSGLQVGV